MCMGIPRHGMWEPRDEGRGVGGGRSWDQAPPPHHALLAFLDANSQGGRRRKWKDSGLLSGVCAFIHRRGIHGLFWALGRGKNQMRPKSFDRFNFVSGLIEMDEFSWDSAHLVRIPYPWLWLWLEMQEYIGRVARRGDSRGEKSLWARLQKWQLFY